MPLPATVGEGNIDRVKKIARLRVSSDSVVNKVAGSIAKFTQEGYAVALTAIGAGAVNQGVKAMAAARTMLMQDKAYAEVAFSPTFHTEEIEGRTCTSVIFAVVIGRREKA